MAGMFKVHKLRGERDVYRAGFFRVDTCQNEAIQKQMKTEVSGAI